MIQLVKHYAFRIWSTLLIGWLLSLALLWAWPAPLQSDWVLAPVSVVFAVAFFLIGWMANRSGIYLVDRLRDEAGVWERAGQPDTAEAVFKKALALYDSFLFSPRFKKKTAIRLIAQMARFYLSRTDRNHGSERFVLTYLEAHPQDAEFAQNWLQQVDGRQLSEKRYQDIAGRIGEALPDNISVQQLLANLYLSSRRTDFTARQVYQRALSGEGVTAVDLMQRTRKLLEGIADTAFPPIQAEALSPTSFRKKSMMVEALKAAGSFGCRLIRTFLLRIEFMAESGVRVAVKLAGFLKTSPGARKSLKWTAVALFAVVIIGLVVNTIGHFAKPVAPEHGQTQAVESVITDPFTLQVAAYLKPEHAKNYVTMLKKQNIDAYWTEALGKNKNWYQVRVSHFPDKKSAIAYGEALKSRGIIDDFFVANY